MNLVQNLRRRVELQPGVPAVIDHTVRGDRVVSFANLNRLTDYLSIKLREEDKIVRGDRVALLLRPSQEFYGFLFALLQVGAIPLIFDDSISNKEIDAWIRALSPKGCILSHTKWMDTKLDENLRKIEKKIVVNMLRVHTRWLRLGKFGAVENMAEEEPVLIAVTRDRDGKGFGSVWTQKALAETIQRYVLHLRLKAGEIDLCDSAVQLLANVSAGLTSVVPAGFGFLARTGLKRQIEKFKPSRVSTSVDCLSALLRIQPSPLHKIFVTGAPVDSTAIELLSSHVQQANIELLFGLPVPLATAGLSEHEVKGKAAWVGHFFQDIDVAVLPDSRDGAVPKKTIAPPNEIGELAVRAAFCPERIELQEGKDGEPTATPEIFDAGSKRESPEPPWIRTDVRGYLDPEHRFWAVEAL